MKLPRLRAWVYEARQRGLLEPAEVDRSSGYRFYEADQVPIAQVIRRFRDLDMPIDDIHAVLNAPDVHARNQLIAIFSFRRPLESGP